MTPSRDTAAATQPAVKQTSTQDASVLPSMATLNKHVGNEGMQKLMRAHLLQRKAYAIGPVNDPLERQADQVADAVVQKMAAHSNVAASSGAVVQRACSGCEEEMVNRMAAHTGAPAADGGLSTQIDSLMASGGEPLSADVRSSMETAIGHDFGGVRVHRSPAAAAFARAIDAKAATFGGSHIAFGEGQYNPGTSEGKRLLAHELTHVAQAKRGLHRASTSTGGMPFAEEHEAEAEAVEQSVAQAGGSHDSTTATRPVASTSHATPRIAAVPPSTIKERVHDMMAEAARHQMLRNGSQRRA